MRYRRLGESGLVVSVAGLGCNNFGGRLDLDGTRAVVDAAIDAGITLFDTSDTYGVGGGSERALGEILLETAIGALAAQPGCSSVIAGR
jgi:aryl-alcohol dehydrogenase-like predicted oxidoreductase